MYEWKPPKVDMEAFRVWHAKWVAEYRRKNGRDPAQLKGVPNENDSQRHRLREETKCQ